MSKVIVTNTTAFTAAQAAYEVDGVTDGYGPFFTAAQAAYE